MSFKPPCGACKFHRRKCTPECIYAPYFPPEDIQKFVYVHKIFGSSNVTKLLSDLHPAQRQEAARALIFEAESRLRDPLYGCVRYVAQLQEQLEQLKCDISIANEELATYIRPSALLPTFPQHQGYNHANGGQMLYNNNPVVPQQQMVGNPPSAVPYTNLISAPSTFVYKGAGSSQQQQAQQMMNRGGIDINMACSNSASALPYTRLMPSEGLSAVAAVPSVMIHEQQAEQLQHGVVDPMIQHYGGEVGMAATIGDHAQHDDDQLLRNYEQQQHQNYMGFKSGGGVDQYELQSAATESFIQMAAAVADHQEEVGAAGPSVVLGVNYDQNPYNNNRIHGQQQAHDDQLLRNYEQQQHQNYLVIKSGGGGDDDQFELQSAADSFIQITAAADLNEIGAAGPSLALGVNYDQNHYNNNYNRFHDQQQEHDDAQQQHIAFQAPLLLQPHPYNLVWQTHQRKAESDGR